MSGIRGVGGWHSVAIGLAALTVGACSSGEDGSSGTPPPAQSTTVRGTVLAPNGQLAKAAPPSPLRWLASLFEIAESWAQASGWSPVPNATVRVFRIDDDGNPIGAIILSTTTNANGGFYLDFPPNTSFMLATDLVVQIWNGPTAVPVGTANSMILPIHDPILTLSPATEAAMRALIARPEPLANLYAHEAYSYFRIAEALVYDHPPATGNLETQIADITANQTTMGDFQKALSALLTPGYGPLVSIGIDHLPVGTVGQPYFAHFLSAGGNIVMITGTSLTLHNTNLPPGVSFDSSFGLFSGIPTSPGIFSTDFVLCVAGECITDTAVIIVQGPTPTASFTVSPVPVQISQTASFDASGSSDADGTIVAYEWDFTNDGTIDATGVTTQFTYNTAGTFTARLRVTDNDGFVGETTRTVQVVLNPPTGTGGVLERVSVDSVGTQSNGNSPVGISERPSISRDGRYVAFSSVATNLLANNADTNGVADVFLRDTCRTTAGPVGGCTPSTIRISLTSTGAQADQASVNPVISGNGRYVVFMSRATLTPNDATTGRYDIYRYDRQTGQIVLVNITQAGQFGGYSSGVVPAISNDGRFIAWGDSSIPEIFIKDLVNNTLDAIAFPQNPNPTSSLWNPAISDDGHFVAFASTHSYVAPDTNGFEDVYVVGRQGSVMTSITRITNATSIDSVRGDLGVSISADGNQIAYVTKDQEPGNPVDTNNALDVYVYNRQTQTKTLVSVGRDANGNPVASASSNQFGVSSANPSVSADGSSVAFDSNAENLVTIVTGSRNVFVRSFASSQTRLSSVSPCGIAANNVGANLPALAGDGSLLAFAADASNLVQGSGTNCDGDTNFRRDVFVAR
jgi:hypothetical protein